MITLQINSHKVEFSKFIVLYSFAMCLAFCAFIFSVAVGSWVAIVAPMRFKIVGGLMIWGGCIAYSWGVQLWKFLIYTIGKEEL
jgi:hypothetical protein